MLIECKFSEYVTMFFKNPQINKLVTINLEQLRCDIVILKLFVNIQLSIFFILFLKISGIAAQTLGVFSLIPGDREHVPPIPDKYVLHIFYTTLLNCLNILPMESVKWLARS